MRQIYVYIAGPYSSDPLPNTRKAIDTAEELIKLGFETYVPHLTHYWEFYHHQHPYEFWLKYDLAWLKKCNCLLRIPGESGGADKEVAWAEDNDIRVFHDIESLKMYYEGRR